MGADVAVVVGSELVTVIGFGVGDGCAVVSWRSAGQPG